jgi:RNA polymerase sigma factor (sigma-70 family)
MRRAACKICFSTSEVSDSLEEPKEVRLKPEPPSPADAAGRFRTTCWSAVLLSAQSQAPGSRDALAEICRIYWQPIYLFVRRRGFDVDEAQDLTQGFFLHLLHHKTLRQVSPIKGKFRSFLAASLQNYILDQVDHAHRLKRGGRIDFVPFDTKESEYRPELAAPDCLTAEKIFDARWALALLDEAMTRLAREYAAQRKATIFEALKPFLDPINNKVSISYEQVAHDLHVSVGAVKTLIHRLRKRYSALLREEVGRTVSDPREIDGEIHALCEALVATEGRLNP